MRCETNRPSGPIGPEGLMNNPVYIIVNYFIAACFKRNFGARSLKMER
jgi:hypothetical protein